MTPFELVLARLGDRVKNHRAGRARARCPVHDDREASLAVSIGDDRRVLLWCFAGCATEAIVQTLNLTMADLYDRPPRGGASPSANRVVHSNTSRSGLTLAAYAAAKHLPLAFLHELGLTDVSYLSGPAVRIPYRTVDGNEVATQFRLTMTGADRFRWKRGDKPRPYGLWRLKSKRSQASIVLVEGASDCHTLWHHEIDALGIPGAATWRREWDAYVEPFRTIYVVLEPDQGGEAVFAWISHCQFRDQVRFVTLDHAKDPSELYLGLGDGFLTGWQAAIDHAVPWAKIDAQRREALATTYAGQAIPLLEDPLLLDRIGAAMHESGYAGDLRVPLLVYLALTSRHLESPQNLALVAPSAAGKNRAVDAAVALIPPEGVYAVSAASPRAFIYTPEELAHRVVVVAEADSLPEEGAAASAIRALATENRMVYNVVQSNPQTGQHETRRIEKLGPTGLITTSTRPLGTQMGTRVLEVTLRDDPAQTRLVMEAQAAQVMPGRRPPGDLEPFLALQRWLTAAGVRKVAVPFAHILVDCLPAHSIRMRRDFRQLLTTIQSVAFLHQRQRPRTGEGWVQATLADYAIARDVLEPIFDAVVADALTPAVRATVEAISPDEEVSESEVAHRLHLAKSTVAYRVRRALEGGWLVNREVRRGYAARLAREAPLPDSMSVLPSVETVRRAFERSNPIPMDGPPSPVPADHRSIGMSDRLEVPLL